MRKDFFKFPSLVIYEIYRSSAELQVKSPLISLMASRNRLAIQVN